MLRLVYSNRSESLIEELAVRLQKVRQNARRTGVFGADVVDIVVPNRNMERYLSLGLAETLGVASHLRFHRLETFVTRWFKKRESVSLMSQTDYESAALSLLSDEETLQHPGLSVLRRYLGELGTDTSARKQAQLAQRLGALFQSYSGSRPRMLLSWASGTPQTDGGVDEGWQSILFQQIHSKDVSGRVSLPTALSELREPTKSANTTSTHIFGLSYIGTSYLWALHEMSKARDMNLYVVNPCRQYWEDLRAPHRDSDEAQRDAIRVLAALESEGEEAPFSDLEEPLPLLYWGAPGREFIRRLGEVTGFSAEEAYVENTTASLLAETQRAILDRLGPTELTPQKDVDDSIRIHSCPSIRREVETVAKEIWRHLSEDDSLRVNDIAVFLNRELRDAYLPHIASVFTEAHGIPHNIVDLPLSSHSRIAEAAAMLIDLPLREFSRSEVQPFLTHPSVSGANASRFIQHLDDLGVFHGIDRSDHRGTYIQSDHINWEQGVKRLVLGSFQEGACVYQSKEGENYLPQRDEDGEGAKLAVLVRALGQDVRFAQGSELTLTEWSQFFVGMFRSYLSCADDSEEGALRSCIRAAASVGEREHDQHRFPYRVAYEIVRSELADLDTVVGEYLADGVVVSSFMPMRAIPFRHVFVLGLSDSFPSKDVRDLMDLRTQRHLPGDVSASERDKYVFLETLLGAKDSFNVSWVSQDAVTGDQIAPSSVVSQLVEWLSLLSSPVAGHIVEHPLRRHEEASDVFCESQRELASSNAGSQLRSELGRDLLDVEVEGLKHAAAIRPLLAAPFVATVEASKEQVLLSKTQLLRFLESPISGWAGWVGLRRSDAKLLSDVEPFEPEPLARTNVLRRAFTDAEMLPAPLRATYEEFVSLQQSRGVWPVGRLATQASQGDAVVLSGWKRLTEALSDATLEAPIRFGATYHSNQAAVSAPLPAILTTTDSGLEVCLRGTTEPLVRTAAFRGSLVLIPRPVKGKGEHQVERLRYALRAFLDHMFLCAAGASTGAHRALVLYGGQPAFDGSMSFMPCSQADAMNYLRTLSDIMVSRSHAYYFPCESVFSLVPRWSHLKDEDFVRSAGRVRSRGNSRDRFGPLRNATGYSIPSPEEARDIAETRYGLMLRLLGVVS